MIESRQPSDATPDLDPLLERLKGAVERITEPISAAALHRLLDLSRAMNQIRDTEELLSYIRDRLRELFQAEKSHVILLGGGPPRVLGAAPKDADELLSHTILDRVVRLRRPVLIPSTADDEELKDQHSVNRLGLVAALCAPLIVDDEIIGVLQFYHRRDPIPFAEQDLPLLELFAHQAATAIHNMVLAQERESVLADLRRTQNLLVARERLHALGHMSANVAHHFNNCASSMLGLVELIRLHPELPSAIQNDVDQLKTCVLDSVETVSRLQEFARGTASNTVPTALDPAELVKEVVARHRGQFPDHELSSSCEGECLVLGQPGALREVLGNLINNAVEATPEGGKIEIECHAHDASVSIKVRDYGPGIETNILDRIFEPFVTTKPEGNGLGLSICWGMVQSMGGQLRVDTNPQATEFEIELPLSSGVATGSNYPLPDREECRTLLVEDEERVLETLTRILETFGHDVVATSDARLALKLACDEPFDLLITDVRMPALSGVELLQRLEDEGVHLPVVIMTGWDDGHLSDAGTSHVLLAKPFDLDGLRSAVRNALQKRHSENLSS